MANSLSIDLTGKFVTMHGQGDTVFLVTGGFGAQSDTSGSAVFVTEQGTGLHLRFSGYDVEGLVDDPKTPLRDVHEVLAEAEDRVDTATAAWHGAAESLATAVVFDFPLKTRKELKVAAAKAHNAMAFELDRFQSARWRLRDVQKLDRERLVEHARACGFALVLTDESGDVVSVDTGDLGGEA